MDSSIKTRRSRACQQLRALLRDQPQALSLPARRLLGELAAARATDDGERRGIVEDTALVLDELVEEGQLSDESANALWLALAGCAQSVGQPRRRRGQHRLTAVRPRDRDRPRALAKVLDR